MPRLPRFDDPKTDRARYKTGADAPRFDRASAIARLEREAKWLERRVPDWRSKSDAYVEGLIEALERRQDEAPSAHVPAPRTDTTQHLDTIAKVDAHYAHLSSDETTAEDRVRRRQFVADKAGEGWSESEARERFDQELEYERARSRAEAIEYRRRSDEMVREHLAEFSNDDLDEDAATERVLARDPGREAQEEAERAAAKRDAKYDAEIAEAREKGIR